MHRVVPLVKIFLQQMIRSKALWIMSGILALMILLNFYYQNQMREWLQEGMTYDMATQKAASNLKQLANDICEFSILFILIISALVAPASRKNGTAQFVLGMQISRFQLALSQFWALSVFIAAAVIIIHLGFGIAALHVNYIGLAELLFGWLPFLLILLITSAAVFSLSLSFSSIMVYIIIYGVPYVLLSLLEALIQWKGQWVPVAIARLIDNIGLLFPDLRMLIFWPHLFPETAVTDPPYPIWHWPILNFLFAAGFWIALGYYFYRNYNIGSRQSLK